MSARAGHRYNPGADPNKNERRRGKWRGYSSQTRHRNPHCGDTYPTYHDDEPSVAPKDPLRIRGMAEFRINRHAKENSWTKTCRGNALDYGPNDYPDIHHDYY